MTHTTKKMSRRDALKILGAAAGASVLANLPSRWSTPQLASGVLPAHAQTSALLPVVETVSVVFLEGVSLDVSSVLPRGDGARGSNLLFTGQLTDAGGSDISDAGFVWSSVNTSPTKPPDDSASVLVPVPLPGLPWSFFAKLFILPIPQYVRAYATNATGTGYGGVLTLTSGTA